MLCWTIEARRRTRLARHQHQVTQIEQVQKIRRVRGHQDLGVERLVEGRGQVLVDVVEDAGHGDDRADHRTSHGPVGSETDVRALGGVAAGREARTTPPRF